MMETKALVDYLRSRAIQERDTLLGGSMLKDAADRLERYEADRCHGAATVDEYNTLSLMKQARLLSDAAEVFAQGGKQNEMWWQNHVGKVNIEWQAKHGKDDPNPGRIDMDVRGEMIVAS